MSGSARSRSRCTCRRGSRSPAPPLHVVARFEVGPVGLTLEFGDRVTRAALHSVGRVRRASTSRRPRRAARACSPSSGGLGSIPPSGSSATGGDKSPDGTPDRPFRVVAEFEMTITSTAPLRSARRRRPAPRSLRRARVVSVAPMGLHKPARHPAHAARWSVRRPSPLDRIARLEAVPQQLGAFPIGTWGIAPDADAIRRCRPVT